MTQHICTQMHRKIKLEKQKYKCPSTISIKKRDIRLSVYLFSRDDSHRTGPSMGEGGETW